MPPAHELTAAPSPRFPAIPVPRITLRHGVALAVLGLTALTFLWPSAPTYDPWAWIIWGREILHLDLSTVDGPSWKPLPVLLTTPFALFGGLAPDLWLFVARAGAIAGVVMAFRVARRLGGLPAGAAAAAAYAILPWTIRNAWLGNSEGLLVALVFAGVDRHLAGRQHHAFLFGLGAALLRPEAWPFLALYGLWLLWSDRGARRLVIGGFVALVALWLLPELWGSGDLLRAAHRAHTPNSNSAAFADDPIREVLRSFDTMLSRVVKWGVVAMAALALTRIPRRAERRTALVLLAAGAIWVAEVAVMTNDGFSGNSRYLIMPVAIACVLAGTGVGWAVRALPRRVVQQPLVVPALAVVAALVFVQPHLDRVDPVMKSNEYQSRLADGLAGAVARAGGRDRILSCGTPFTGRFQVPVVAYALGLHTTQVKYDPLARGVAFRAHNTAGERPSPSLDALGGESAVQTFAIANGWRIVGRCG